LLDAPTLFTAATCITGLLGLFLLIVWVQERSIRSLAWWGAAYLVGASAVALWGAQGQAPFVTAAVPNALLFTACGMIWNGARLFHGAPLRPAALFTGALVWLVAMQIPAFAQSDLARVVLSSLIIATYTFLTAVELRRERRKPRSGAHFTVGVPLLHGAVFLSPIPLTVLLPAGASEDGWFALFALETLLYVVGTAFIVVVMAKEQVLHVHKTLAMTDALTGLFNRRAFLEAAERMIAMQARRRESMSVLAFDLDHFKSINDRFGHALGDEALKLFAATASANTRVTDVIGRLGGEEFAALVPGPLSDAMVVAERVRAAFETAGVTIGGRSVGATVSIGIATTRTPVPFDALLERADAALYAAKANGRNRIETEAEPRPGVVAGATPSAAKELAPAH
jgi:diguanylate cyclase (GGDEF)-like protein